jgi:hypothetical protein
MDKLNKNLKPSLHVFKFRLYLLGDWVSSSLNGKLESMHKFKLRLSVYKKTFFIKINLADFEFYCLGEQENFLRTFRSLDEIKEWIELGCLYENNEETEDRQ